jgi:hypothetical protein
MHVDLQGRLQPRSRQRSRREISATTADVSEQAQPLFTMALAMILVGHHWLNAMTSRANYKSPSVHHLDLSCDLQQITHLSPAVDQTG